MPPDRPPTIDALAYDARGTEIIRKLLVVFAITLLAVGTAGLSPSLARSACLPPCELDDEPPPPPPPPPAATTITGISPGFAWSGDTIALTGWGFSGATVSIDNQPAAISSRTNTQLTVTVPTITSAIAGPVTIPVVVASPTGTASTSFTLSGTLQLSAWATYGVNAQFGQGMDGSARATATLDRRSGFAVSTLTVTNRQMWLPLSVNISTVWLDSSGTVIAFTTPRTITSGGWAFNWPNVETTTTGDFTQVVGPNPGVAPFTRSARILLVRNHEAEVLSTLSTAVSAGRTIAQVVTALAPFLV
jgi:hypothetical protein